MTFLRQNRRVTSYEPKQNYYFVINGVFEKTCYMWLMDLELGLWAIARLA